MIPKCKHCGKAFEYITCVKCRGNNKERRSCEICYGEGMVYAHELCTGKKTEAAK